MVGIGDGPDGRLPVWAQLHWVHGDWELACDNTRSCRAAGYTAEDAALRSSVLIERAGGPGTPVLLHWKVEAGSELLRPPLGLRVGKLRIQARGTSLGPADSASLVQAMLEAPTLEMDKAGERWSLPLQGLKAVLLKMDEAQGRLDTPQALVRRGKRSEQEVPPALSVPKLRVQAFMGKQANDAATLRLMWSAVRERECWESVPDAEQPLQTADRVDAQTWLLTRECARGAYQSASMAWLVSTQPPYRPRLLRFATRTQGEEWVELPNLEVGNGLLSSHAKGRGLGDCTEQAQWAWTGQRFELLSQSSSGMCRGFAGGAWELPVFVAEPR